MTEVLSGTRRPGRTCTTSVCRPPQSQVGQVIRKGKLDPLQFVRDTLRFLKEERPRGPTETARHQEELGERRVLAAAFLQAARAQRAIHEQEVAKSLEERAKLLASRQATLAQSARLAHEFGTGTSGVTVHLSGAIRLESSRVVAAQAAITRIDKTLDALEEVQRHLHNTTNKRGEGNGDSEGTGSVE